MPTKAGSAIYNNFIKGLITDSSNLNSDVNSIKEGYNFVLTNKGTLEKRLGLGLESSFSNALYTNTTSLITKTSTTYDGRRWYVVFDKVSKNLSILNSSDNTLAYSTTVLSTEANVSYSFNDRYIVVSTNWSDITVLEYVLGVWVELDNVEVKVRDFEGVIDNLANDERPVSLTDEHRYNLENQGWGSTLNDINVFKASSHSGYKYPSNSDIASLGRYEDPDKDGNITVRFRTDFITTTTLGNGLAPRGKKILSTVEQYPKRFNDYQNCERVETVSTNVCTDTDEYGDCTRYGTVTEYTTECTNVPGASLELEEYPFGNSDISVCNTFFAGRVFYGARNNVMFSQQVGQTSKNFGTCYQEADPTSSEISDIIETDGGMIKITGASGIFKLIEFQDQLLVFAKNGIWSISGGETSFTAVAYSVRKVSTYTALTPDSVVEVPGAILFLSTAGIMAVTRDNVSFDANVKNLSKGTIQEYYNSFSDVDLINADMLFSVKEEVLYIRIGTDILVFNTTLGAFYKLEIPPNCVGMLYQDSTQVIKEDSNIVNNGTPVVSFGEDVVISLDSTISVVGQIRFLYQSGTVISLYSMSGVDYLDFGTDGYDSYFVTTNIMFDHPLTNKRLRQVSCFFEKTETGYAENVEGGLEYVNPSQCSLQVGWDMPLPTSFHLDPRNKWSRPYGAYRLTRYESKDLGEVPGEALDTIVTRTSIRGRGRSVMFRFSSEPGYDCRLLGWVVDLDQNTRIK